MLFGTQVLSMAGRLASLADWLFSLRRRPARPQPTVRPSCKPDAGPRGDRRRLCDVTVSGAEDVDPDRVSSQAAIGKDER